MGSIIAVDSMIFIYLFEDDTRFIDEVHPILKNAERGKGSLITSIISVAETLSPAKYLVDEVTPKKIQQFFSETQGLTIYPVDWNIAVEAAILRQKHRFLKTPDAIQLATAIVHKADIFITNDAKLKTLSLPGLTIQTLS